MIHRFIISGDNVQGIQLRESFAKKANSRRLKGSIRNLSDGRVEALFLCRGNEEDILECVKDAIAVLDKKGLLDNEELRSIQINGKPVETFEAGIIQDEETEKLFEGGNFALVREHELKETVWALQGAGRVFFIASEKVDDLLGYKKKELSGRLESVKRELLYIQSNMKNVGDPVCIRQLITDPPGDFSPKEHEEDLITNLIEFYHDYATYKREQDPNSGKRDGETEQQLVARAHKLEEMINKQTEKA